MLTLKTLAKASAQEVFDQVAAHLLKQNAKSVSQPALGQCLYRGPNGVKCAAGCLIGDDEFNDDLNNYAWTYLVKTGTAPACHSTLIQDLQNVHDKHPVSRWPQKLQEVAHKHGLKT